MATTTTKLGLRKPAGTDLINVTTDISDNMDLIDAFLQSLVPLGVVLPYSDDATPANTDWLLAQGQAVSRATYADYFTLVGTTYGVGDGATTFNLPNLKGRIPVGLDATVTAFDTLAETNGSKDAVVVTHAHDTNVYKSVIEAAGFGLTISGSEGFEDRVQVSAITGDNTDSTGVSGTDKNLQPYIVLNYIVKVKK